MASFGAIRGLLRPILQHRLRADTPLIVLCEALSAIPDAASEKLYHLDNEWKYPARDRLQTPLMFQDYASLTEMQAAEKSFKEKTYREFTVATQRPSDWLFPAAIRQTNANHPVEDRGILATLKYRGRFLGEDLPARQWMLAAVIDGHSGWQTSEFVARNLAQFVDQRLSKFGSEGLTAAGVSELLTTAFLELDSTLRAKITPAVELGHSTAAKPGATTVCCLMNGSHIVVANLGDSRAVLCRDGKPVALSACHNAGDPIEAERLRAAHPGEADIIKEKAGSLSVASVSPSSSEGEKEQRLIYDMPENSLLRLLTMLRVHDFSKPRMPSPACYTKGRLQLTRAFGDFYLKEARYANDWTTCRLLVNTPHSFPYVSARPEITVVAQDAAHDEFLILASDGVWDELTPADACAVVKRELAESGSAAAAATAVQRAVVERVAYKQRLEVAQIEALPPKQRRSVVDDITCIVVDLQQRDNGD